MENTELIALREQYASGITKYAKRKKKFVYITIIGYLIMVLLFLIAVIGNGDNDPKVAYYHPLMIISICLGILSTISLVFWIYNGVQENNMQKKRDKVSYELTHNVLK